MSIADIRSLPLDEKFQIMEALWQDLREPIDDSPAPDWQKDLLDRRHEAVQSGAEQILDWDDVKKSI